MSGLPTRRVLFNASGARRAILRGRDGQLGTAVVELAVCLPLLTLVVFGSIQACNLIYLKHGAVTAAYEAMLELAKRNATNASVEARAQQVLDARGINTSRIELLPTNADVSKMKHGDELTIDVQIDVAPNMALSGFIPLPHDVTGRVVGTR